MTHTDIQRVGFLGARPRDGLIALAALAIVAVGCVKASGQGVRDGGLTDGGGPVLAFPGAVGWGRHATGGRNGGVRKVTNLNDAGPGSFRAAVEPPGAATVIFEVAGTINLQRNVVISSDKTIAGETAFRNGGGGVTLKINQGTTRDTLVTISNGSNINNRRPSASDPEWDAIGCSSGCGAYMREPAPIAWRSATAFDFPLKDVATMTADAVKSGVLNHAGANLRRDAVDIRLFNDVLNGTGGFIDCPSEVGGWPVLPEMSSVPVDADNDGMADAWEMQTFGTLATGATDDTNGDGYTNLETYLHHLAAGSLK